MRAHWSADPPGRSVRRYPQPPVKVDPASRPSPQPAAARPDGVDLARDEELAAILSHAVEEASRLLGADGGMVYLLDAASGRLRFARDAGVTGARRRAWARELSLAPGEGLFGRAVATGQVATTGDYPADQTIVHTPDADRVVREVGIRSMLVAPMSAAGGVVGALGIFSSRPSAFDQADAALVRALADHAASSVANRRLIEELALAKTELQRSAEAERTLREIAARLVTIRDPLELLEHVVRTAGRLVGADGAILARYDPERELLYWALDDGVQQRFDPDYVASLSLPVGVGVTGRAVAERRVVVCNEGLIDAFPRSPQSDHFFEVSGFHSMIAAPIASGDDLFGALEVYATREGAFRPSDADLIAAFADEAAIALTNARLIEDLAGAREIERRHAQEEHALREISARITALPDPGEVLEEIAEQARRLLGADLANIDLMEPIAGRMSWTSPPEAAPSDDGLVEMADLGPAEELPGLWGRAVFLRRVVATDDYLADTSFRHDPAIDANARRFGLTSAAAAPLLSSGRLLGTLQVATRQPGAYGRDEIALLEALATLAASAIASSRRVAELRSSQAELARRADRERTLREIAARVTAIRDPDELLQRIVDEAVRLLEADGARIDLYDPAARRLGWAFAAGATADADRDFFAEGGLALGEGVAGKAVAEGRTVLTGDYLTDTRLEKSDAAVRFVQATGVRSILGTPLEGDNGPLGALLVTSRHGDAFTDADAEILQALGIQASIAITNSRRLEELGRSRVDLAHRADTERTLREIAARIAALHDPRDVLQLAVDEAARLLHADGARIDVGGDESAGLRERYGEIASGSIAWVGSDPEHIGGPLGVSGRAIEAGVAFATDDYLADTTFPRSAVQEAYIRTRGIRSVLSAPLPGEGRPIGALTAVDRKPAAFDAVDAATLTALATHASLAVISARLIEDLARSRGELARSVETERTLREIAARIAALTDPAEVLTRVVEEARRLLGSEGAHLTRMSDDRSHLVPVVVAGGMDAETTAWLTTQQFPLNGGINGLAAGRDRVIWTEDYLTDPRIPHEPDDHEVAERMGLRAMAAAPLHVPGGEVIGTLAVSSREPRTFSADELDRLQGLADHAAIALANSLLFERLTRSESRYRVLVEGSPDIVFETDAKGRLTYLSESIERLLRWAPAELIGQNFLHIVDEASAEEGRALFARIAAEPQRVEQSSLALIHQDGRRIPFDLRGSGLISDGAFGGVHGSARDVGERERLQRELVRQAEELASSQERSHLARELHDSVTQALFSMGLVIRSVEVLLERDPTLVRERLEMLAELQRDALAEIRSLIFELRPGSLAEDGLVQALRTHVAGVEGRIGLPVILEADVLMGRLPAPVEEALYRIAQEALHNTVKHAAAHVVRIEIRASEDSASLAVEDDGLGFDPETIEAGHLGLPGMRTRAERLGGRLEIRSRRRRGTRIEVTIPLERA